MKMKMKDGDESKRIELNNHFAFLHLFYSQKAMSY